MLLMCKEDWLCATAPSGVGSRELRTIQVLLMEATNEGGSRTWLTKTQQCCSGP